MKIGMTGSPAHVLTNKKVEDKKACLKEIYKQAGKDVLTLYGVTAGVAGTAALAASKSNKFAGALHTAKNAAGELLSKVSINGENLKEIVKNTSSYKTFNSLPTPAKAAIAFGTAVLAAAPQIFACLSAAKSGYIEGKHEVK